MLLAPSGRRTWYFKYFFGEKERHVRFGRYPEISLKMARDMRLEARRALELGNDSGTKQEEERSAHSATFETVANEWMEIQRSKLAPKTFECKLERFRAFVFPYIGQRPIAAIKALDVLGVLRRIEERGRNETATAYAPNAGMSFGTRSSPATLSATQTSGYVLSTGRLAAVTTPGCAPDWWTIAGDVRCCADADR